MRSIVARQTLFFALILPLLLNGCRGIVDQPIEPGPLPETRSPVKRAVVIVMQNHSFNNLFGTFPGVDGIRPGVRGYTQRDSSGNSVTPFKLDQVEVADLPHGREDYLNSWNNGAMDGFARVGGRTAMGYYDDTTPGVDKLWSWAQQFALADKYFSSVMGAAPSNQLYMIAASNNNNPSSVQPAFGPCNQQDPNSQPYTFRNLGDQLNDRNISWGWFHERLGDCPNYVATQNPFQYFTSTQNTSRIQDMNVFFQRLQDDTLPAVSFIQPGPSNSSHPGSGSITRALDWLDETLRAIQGSSAWGSVAVMVVWDEGGGWWDHVPPPQIDSQGLGIRVPLLLVSPFARKGFISSARMDHVSILRFIQWNWNLGRLNARNSRGGDTIELSDMFDF